jgi:hypothetical protein
MGMYFVQCGKEGKFMVPIANSYPFLNLMGNITLGWLLFWQAGIASRKLEEIYKENGVDVSDKKAVRAFISEHKDAAFYDGKIHSARYYAKHVLPQAKSLAESIKSEDLTCLKISDESFAS